MDSWKLYALLSAFFAALTAVFAKISVSEINSDLATLYRTVVIGVLSLAVVLARNEWQSLGAVSVKGITFIVLSGIATGLSWLFYFRALQLGPASRVAPIDKLSVVLVVILSVALLGERLTWKSGVGALLICSGAVLTAL
jgi:bacterial/archaeal transporter family protein